MTSDNDKDAILSALGRLSSESPSEVRTARLRARCHEALREQRRQVAVASAGSAAVRPRVSSSALAARALWKNP
jgi:hypothetical protein